MLEYVYSAPGDKLAKKLNGTFTQFYCGNVVYKGDKTPEYVATSEGLALYDGGQYAYQYNLTDHLGNVRAVADASGSVVQKTDYYPFGLAHALSSLDKNKYLYNGKELQNELLSGTSFGMLDYGARFYDPTIGRWHSVDPLAEKYQGFSPYVYVSNNPLKYIDPNGCEINVSAIMKYDEENGTNYLQKIIGDLASQTGLSYSITKAETLAYKKDKKGNAVISTDAEGNEIGSATARTIMTKAIDDNQITKVSISFSTESGERENKFSLNPAQIDDYIAGSIGVDNRTLGYGMAFLHELSHTKAGGDLRDTPHGWGNPGPLENRLNQARSELNAQGGNYGQRMTYEGYNTRGVGYIPFSAGSTVRLINCMVPSQSQYIRYTRLKKNP